MTPAPPTKLLPEPDLWRQLSNAIQMRTSGDQIAWTTLSIFWAANALLLSALFRNGDYPNPQVGAIIAAFASLLSLLWYFIEKRILGRLNYHDKIIRTIQNELFKDNSRARALAVCQALTDAEDERELGKSVRARVLIPRALLGVLAIWVVGFSCFLCVAITSRKG
jgi:hypothetical protein